MGKLILYGAGLVLIISFIMGMLTDYGWRVVVWPLIVVGALVGLVLLLGYPYLVGGWRDSIVHRRAEQIAALEAAQGIGVPLGSARCPECQLRLPLGAAHCPQCGATLELASDPDAAAAVAEVPVVCLVCYTRQVPAARFCSACGVALRPEPMDGPSGSPEATAAWKKRVERARMLRLEAQYPHAPLSRLPHPSTTK